jgi:hypothetical protein
LSNSRLLCVRPRLLAWELINKVIIFLKKYGYQLFVYYISVYKKFVLFFTLPLQILLVPITRNAVELVVMELWHRVCYFINIKLFIMATFYQRFFKIYFDYCSQLLTVIGYYWVEGQWGQSDVKNGFVLRKHFQFRNFLISQYFREWPIICSFACWDNYTGNV